MKKNICTVPDCRYFGRYCRIHPAMEIPEVNKLAEKSERRKVIDRQYKKIADQFKKDHPRCEASLEGCTHTTTQIHHMKGRCTDEDYLNPDYFLAVCFNCHRIIEENPVWAIAEGLSLSRLAK
jgi:hypothetical protein